MLFLTAFRNDISSREIFKPKIRPAFHARVKLIQKKWSDVKNNRRMMQLVPRITFQWCHLSRSPIPATSTPLFPLLFPSCFLCPCPKWEEERYEERGWGIQDVKRWEMRKGGDVGGLAWSLKTLPLRPNYGLTHKLQTDVWTCLHAEESRTRSQPRNKDRKRNDDVIQMLKQTTDVGNKVCQHSKEIWVVCSCFFFLLKFFLIEASKRWM